MASVACVMIYYILLLLTEVLSMTDLTLSRSMTDRHVSVTSDPALEPSPSYIHTGSLVAPYSHILSHSLCPCFCPRPHAWHPTTSAASGPEEEVQSSAVQ